MDFNKNVFMALEWLEENIDEAHMLDVEKRHVMALEFKRPGSIVAQANIQVPGVDPYLYIDTYDDMEKMLYNELMGCVGPVAIKDDGILSIRANYGVGTIPSLFGAKDKITEPDTKPWADHLSPDEIEAALQAGIPSLEAGYGRRIYDTYSYYREMLEKYPKCKRHIHLCHPDFQGPFDIAHLLMGSDIYYNMYDDPQAVQSLIRLATDTYIAFYRRLCPLLTDKLTWDGKAYCFQSHHIWGGNVVLRNDTAVNLSEEQYLAFVRPSDERILEEIGGGSIHFCGRADQWISEMLKTGNLRGINFGHMEKYEFGQKLLDFIDADVRLNHVPVVCYYLDNNDFEAVDFKKYGTGVTYAFSAADTDDLKRKQEALLYDL